MLLDYIVTDGVWFPHRQWVMYKEDALQEEATVARVVLNPAFRNGFFEGLGDDETETEPVPPAKVEGYSHAEINEFWTNLIWTGIYPGTLDGMTVTNPARDLPNAHHIVVEEKADFTQMILEFEDTLIVFEAPPHQTDLIIRYVLEVLERNITHFYVGRFTLISHFSG